MSYSSSSSSYRMPTSLKRKLEYAKRNFSSNQTPSYTFGSNGRNTSATTRVSTNTINFRVDSYVPYPTKSYSNNYTKGGYEKISKREETYNRNAMNQKFDEIEAAIERAKKDRVARERESALASSKKENTMDPMERELYKAHMINYIDEVLSEESKYL